MERFIHQCEEISILGTHLIVLFHRNPRFSNYNWVSYLSAL